MSHGASVVLINPSQLQHINLSTNQNLEVYVTRRFNATLIPIVSQINSNADIQCEPGFQCNIHKSSLIIYIPTESIQILALITLRSILVRSPNFNLGYPRLLPASLPVKMLKLLLFTRILANCSVHLNRLDLITWLY